MGKLQSIKQALSFLSQGKGGKSAVSHHGGLESITPAEISGWVFHPEHALAEVRFIVGPHLIAQARIDQSRPDVEAKYSRSGSFGFSLTIPSDFPLLEFEDAPSVIALNADGSFRVSLCSLRSPRETNALLKLAFSAEYRGLQGHFDGLVSANTALHGWCFQPASPTEVPAVYLQSQDLSPIKVLCNEVRPGFQEHGFPDNCGFYYHLRSNDFIDNYGGKEVWFTFDQAGLLRLPQYQPCILPVKTALATASHGLTLAPAELSRNIQPERQTQAEMSEFVGLRLHWAELEQFRKYCEFVEKDMKLERPVSTTRSIRSKESRPSLRKLLTGWLKSRSEH